MADPTQPFSVSLDRETRQAIEAARDRIARERAGEAPSRGAIVREAVRRGLAMMGAAPPPDPGGEDS